MNAMQTCCVCGTDGLLVEGRIYVGDSTVTGPAFIGQCPRCKRFVCSRHGEKLDLSEKKKKGWLGLGRGKPASLVVCCPFDPGVALGDPE